MIVLIFTLSHLSVHFLEAFLAKMQLSMRWSLWLSLGCFLRSWRWVTVCTFWNGVHIKVLHVKSGFRRCRCKSIQSLNYVWLFATPWTAACQASLSITNSQSLPKLMSIELVMPSNHLILFIPFSSCLQSFSASGSFLMSQLLASGGQSIGASASLLPMNIQGWFCLGLTSLISLQSKGLSKSLF